MKKVYEIKVSVEGNAYTDRRCHWTGGGKLAPVYGAMLCYVNAESESEATDIVMGHDFEGDFCERGWERVTSVTVEEIEFVGDATPTDEEEFYITDAGLDED